jgi:hypothetical protein
MSERQEYFEQPLNFVLKNFIHKKSRLSAINKAPAYEEIDA